MLDAASRLRLWPFLLAVSFLMLALAVEPALAQDICSSCSSNSQSPAAAPGGPYIGITGQSISFNDAGSSSSGGWITGYYWDFGDGTDWGQGPNPTHQYGSDGIYTVTLWVSDSNGNWDSTQSFVTVNSSTLPVKLTFDELPNNTLVADQYLNSYGVRFYSGNSLAPVHTYQNCGFCSTTSPPNFISTKPADFQPVTIEFTQPASNVSFFFVGLDTLSGQFGRADIYVNGSYFRTDTLNGVFNSTGGFSLPNVNNVTKIVIHSLTDPAGVGIDDLTFTIPADVRITNPRVSGALNGTTRNALVGADITLNANAVPGGFSGGSYSWSFNPAVPVSGGSMFSSSLIIRPINVGTITATVNYTKNGVAVSATVTINVVLPSLTSFTAEQGSDLVSPPGQCRPGSFWWYRLGCTPTGIKGIDFTSVVHADAFISDPAQSGIKYVQAVSAFRKKNRIGLRCQTKRLTESDVNSGWQLDDEDPYVFPEYPIRRFSEGNELTMLTLDQPESGLTNVTSTGFVDVAYIDDRFEMYVVYFTGTDPKVPWFQRPLGKLAWNWGGLVVLDWNGSDSVHHARYSNSSPGQRAGALTSSMVPMQGRVQDNNDVPCPGGPPLTFNNIDSSRVFVKYHYLDFLGRNPAGDATHPPDSVGWNFWTSTISQCVFDMNCIHLKRIDTGLAFFYSGEFLQTDPDMANPPGSPGFNPAVYNRRFVYWCYQKYLQRDPTGDPGWDYWTNDLNSNGNYGHIIDAFQLSSEYRNDRTFL